MRRVLLAVACLMGLIAQVAPAQSWDPTGNSQLSGTYVFRSVIYVPADDSGAIGRAIGYFGTITFNGSGNYTLAGTAVDSGAGSGNFSSSGTYTLGASGYGFMKHPYATTGTMNILLSNGVLMGSSPESFINDLFFAVPAGSATNATFTGAYSMAYLSVGQSYTNTFNTMASLNPNGSGNIGSVPVRSYIGSGTAPINQTENSVTYSFSGGIGTLRFPTSPTNIPLLGNKRMFISADGNFIFGGADNGTDIFVGVRRGSGTPPAMSGLYYSTGMNHIPGAFDSFFGGYYAYTATGQIWEHQRALISDREAPINYTGSGQYPTNPVSDYTDTNSLIEYVVGQDAKFRIGIGQSPYMTLRVGVQAPAFTAPGSGPWINPTGIQNSASSAVFTAGISGGELVTIYGANLASNFVITQGGIPFPTTLGGVQVLMNNRPAPIYYVSPSQVAVIVPYGIPDEIVQIQVIRDSVTSNAVTSFKYQTGPGLFSESEQGQGLAKILHTDYRQVTPDNPAIPGEVLQVFLTGLGPVFPSIADGGLGPVPPQQLAEATLAIGARVDNLDAPVSYKGLAPGLAGLYQVNMTVPAGVSNGDVYVDISTPDAYTSQVTIPIIGGVVPRSARAPVRRR